MNRSDSDDRIYDDVQEQKGQRKSRRRAQIQDDDTERDRHRRKRSSKRSHRLRTHKDDFWDDNQS